jgi:methylthioribose-1-phosphate isomerase
LQKNVLLFPMTPNSSYQAISFAYGKARILDQRELPLKEKYLELSHPREVIAAIKSLAIRGAPLLGLAGLTALHLAAVQSNEKNEFHAYVKDIIHARPTAVQLSLIVRAQYDRCCNFSLKEQASLYYEAALDYEKQMLHESEAIAIHGQTLLKQHSKLLTHCNTGPLAMGGWGTALGIIIYGALMLRRNYEVFYTETRPLQQGLRLTSFELHKHQIPATCIVDSAAAYLMSKGMIDAVITGADRIAQNGDTANKIGTYSLALASHAHSIPFYIAAPWSTFDPASISGETFTIEYRDAIEVLRPYSLEQEKARNNSKVLNPAFDITPGKLITAFITERGVDRPPFHF